MQLQQKPILCLDFDGVIHSYTSGWQGACVIPDPYVPGFFAWAIEAVKYFRLVIYSSRSKEEGAIEAMKLWFGKESIAAINAGEVSPNYEWPKLFDYLEFAWQKPAAFLTIDDRAIRFNGVWSHPDLNPVNLSVFKPWNKL